MIRIGDKVIHNGTEKEVTDVAGDVLILSDGMAVSIDAVSEVTCAHRIVEAARPSMDKAQLRNNIEGLNGSSSIDLIREVMSQVDATMTINPTMPWDTVKKAILHRALNLGKIDHKTCAACGQRIAD